MQKYGELLRNLLEKRGITDEAQADIFLNPVYERDFHDPFLMKDMAKACERIFQATQKNEKIIIYADYDCDGIPGAVILNDLLKKKGYKKNYSCEKLLGCSYNDYLIYIESKFDKWMTHDNFGLYNGTYNYGWDIDHIKPLSKAITEEDIIKLCHYTNLQPLCSKINRDIKKAN